MVLALGGLLFLVVVALALIVVLGAEVVVLVAENVQNKNIKYKII